MGKNGAPALSLYGEHGHLHLNPSGKFIIGGPQGDAGLTGRKIIIDTYGGWGAMGASPSLARTQPRLTGLRRTFADRWPSLLSRAGSQRDALSSCLTPLVLPSLCLCSLKHTEQSADTSHLMTSLM